MGSPGFTTRKPAPRVAPVADILARRKAEFARVDEAYSSRKLIRVDVREDGPIGIAHFGDPHVDDPGCNIGLLERHVALVNSTPGMFGANVGDLQNLWVGRLARLYAEQATTAQESWALTEWLVTGLPWLYLIAGNHDMWAGDGNPLDWMVRTQPGVTEPHGARLNLVFPGGREVRVNARHDFRGHSMWNTVHGAAKAAQMGWRDHILTCGHTHTAGYMPVKCPSSGLISHAIRVASYKTHDRYAAQLGLPDQNLSECVVTVIDPDAAHETALVTVFLDPHAAADFLTWKRGRRIVPAKKVKNEGSNPKRTATRR